MSTRSIIAVGDTRQWRGVYHHWDGYPSGVGQTLFTLYHTVFEKDIERMVRVLIDERVKGWSNINADWTREPMPFALAGAEPAYYSDGDGAVFETERNFTPSCVWLYVLNPDDRTLAIIKLHLDYDHSALVTTLVLDALPPDDWESFDDSTGTRLSIVWKDES